jgi:phosphatidylglycerol:prolipoprotein diacylglycerol transferase
MLPILIKFGVLSIRTYGVFVAIGVFLAYRYVLKNSLKQQINVEFISNLTFIILITAFLGARIFYVVLNFDYYRNDLLSIIKIWEGGLVLYGGVLVSLICGILYILIKKQNFLAIFDLYAPALFLGISFGRLGCFSAGCCYGKPTESFFGVVFSHSESLAPIGIKIFPTQLFESFYSFIIFVILHNFFVKEKFKNYLLFLGLIFYSILRFLNEFLRGDDRGVLIFGLYPSQFISIILIILNIFAIIYFLNKTIPLIFCYFLL